ncbi:serine threonine kinase [Brachionus plicatilis]|uniref:Serine threonine kinase n=1 Tax=Brachionus plicatilis TaxID=10195 RepID=A0A3M7PXX6_BRAPC|nr:serine threonine kinase [Brachionus plicatilis]
MILHVLLDLVENVNNCSQKNVTMSIKSKICNFTPLMFFINSPHKSHEVNKLMWSNMSRVLFHIGDAPCHGQQFHIDSQDSYPSGDPRGLKITDLLRNLTEKNISYFFAEINKSTVKMIDEFSKVLNSLDGSKVKVVNLNSAEDLSELVSSSISSTISDTKSHSMHCLTGKSMKKISVDPSSLSWKIEKMKHYRASLYRAKFNGNIEDIKDKSIELSEAKVGISLADKPFAKGAIRYAYAGMLNGQKFVLKKTASLDPEHNTMKFYTEMVETQVIAKVLANKYFDILQINKNIKFIDVNLICIDNTGEYYTIEEFIPGKFVKWMNNAGSLNEDIYSCALDNNLNTYIRMNENSFCKI